MKVTYQQSLHAALWFAVSLVSMSWSGRAIAQGIATTTVQGTVYLANGQPGSGTLQVSWPAFTTATNQAVAAGRTNVTIGADGYVSVKLAPNQGATPAGLFYTAVYHLSDGSTSTEYWVVPAAAQASLSQIRAQVMPAAQAVQAVSKGYVDQSIQELTQSLLTASGGSLSGPLYLNGDPAQPSQAATKHYVDATFSMALPLSGGKLTGPLTGVQLGAAYQVDQFPGADFGAQLQSCLNNLDRTYGGTCDARNFSGALAISSNLVMSTANATVQLPCATISTANHIQISAGTRNISLHGCALRGASDASGSRGGTVFLYSGTGPMMQIGDSTYITDTLGFHIDNVLINTTASSDCTAQGLAAYRTQEMDLQSLYFLGNSDQTGITLDGTGNYTGGTFQDIQLGGYQIAVNAIGHQTTNSAITDWVNASAFLRLHINCPTSGGSPIAGTYGINLQQGDGNTFTGGDVEGCSTALHLGPNAQNNTIVGLRNENSINQVVADAGSSYNNWVAGGTMFTGQLTDNGTRNSFLDTFHRSFNGLNGDWYGSQKDATVTNHFRMGTGAGNERGLLNRYQTDFGYRWTTGLSDAAGGEQFYQILDELNNVYRLSIGQYNNGQSSTNNQTVINSAGTGAIVLNGSTNAGTGGVLFGSGGAYGGAVASINNAGNAQFNGSMMVGGPSTFTGSTTVKNQADAEIDSFLWAGATGNQKESFTYKDYTGTSQWYMVKDASNNWALNSATGGLDSFKAYQSTNSGDTYVNASNSTGHIRLNYELGSGAETDIYSGSSGSLVAAFLGTNAIKFPGLASSSGRNCLQIDNSGYISNTGVACGGGTNGTVNSGTAGQVAYYAGDGTVIAGTTAVAVAAGGTGATTQAGALANLGAQAALPGVSSDGASGVQVAGGLKANTTIGNAPPLVDIRHPSFAGGAVCDNSTDIGPALQAAWNALPSGGGEILIPGSPTPCYWANPNSFLAPGAGWNSKTTVTIYIQGQLHLGTTWTFPTYTPNISVIGRSGEGVTQFQAPGQSAKIYVRPSNNVPIYGTLNTAVTTAGATPVWGNTSAGSTSMSVSSGTGFPNGSIINVYGAGPYGGILTTTIVSGGGTTNWTLANAASGGAIGSVPSTLGPATIITPSTMNGIFPGTALGIADPQTCNITSVSRASGKVTATLSSTCHIPPGTILTSVAGVTDSSFNGFYQVGSASPQAFMVTASDYVQNTVTWNQTGATASSSGGTITGLNEDTVEYVQVTSTTATTFTAVFARTHTAAAWFGAVAVNVNEFSGGNHLWKDIQIASDGPGMLLQQDYLSRLQNVGISAGGGCYGFWPVTPLVIGDAAFITADGITLASSCQAWSIHMTQPWNQGYTSSGPLYLTNSFIDPGIKLDHGAAGVFAKNVVLEQGTGAFAMIDPTNYWSGNQQMISIENSGMQDNPNGFKSCFVYYETPPTSGASGAQAILKEPGNDSCMVNDYFGGSLSTELPNAPPSFGQKTARGVVGVYNDGKVIEAEVRGEQAGFSPAVIPYSTLNVTTNPASWTGSCSVATGVLAPDGTLTAGALTGNGSEQAGLWNITPAAGDQIIFGGWVYTPTLGKPASGGSQAFMIDNYGSTHYYFNSGQQAWSTVFDSQITNDWWHPIVSTATVTSADGTAGWLRFNLACSNTLTMDYWQPFMIYIKASDNIPPAEVARWRSQLLHGAVPPNMPSGGGILGINPAHKLYWGSDTNLYRGAAGVVQTDGAMNIGAGKTYQVNGTQIATGNLGDWTNSGITNGFVPVWNSTTGKWTPGNPSGGGNVTGPGSATSGDCASFNGATGQVIQDSGFPCSGIPYVVAKIDLTGQTGNIGNANIYNATGHPGRYRASCYEVMTTAATTSATLPQCAITFVDADTGTQVHDTSGSANIRLGATSNQNYVGATNLYTGFSTNDVTFRSAGNIIQYNTQGYASSGATAMQYAIHITLEYLGP